MNEKIYGIKVHLFEVDIFEANLLEMDISEFLIKTKIIYFLTENQLKEKIKKFLNKGYKVNIGYYVYKWRKYRFIPSHIVKEVTEDGQILYR